MSSTIVHQLGLPPGSVAAATEGAAADEARNPFLVSLGERVRALRSRRGLTRKALARGAGVSERHLANLELGVGNVSILVLAQVAAALQCSLAEIVGDVTTATPEWLLLRGLLERRDDATLHRVRIGVAQMLVGDDAVSGRWGVYARSPRIALIGLRGAGKSTLGQRLADELGFPYVELSREIEQMAGCSVGEIQALYGPNAYRRYERRALQDAIQQHHELVLATPGGIVADATAFNQLLSNCTTVWLKARPEDHMKRVTAQGDLRPMAASREAMADLKGILAGRSAFYSKAEFKLDTSAQSIEPTYALLRSMIRQALGLAELDNLDMHQSA